MFSLFIFIHCFFPFALPTYFSALFTSRSAGYRGTLHDFPNRCCILLCVCAVNSIEWHNMCDTKFSIYLNSVRFGIRTCAGGHVSLGFSVSVFLSVCLVWVFSLGVLPALFHFASLLFRDVARRADF